MLNAFKKIKDKLRNECMKQENYCLKKSRKPGKELNRMSRNKTKTETQ